MNKKKVAVIIFIIIEISLFITPMVSNGAGFNNGSGTGYFDHNNEQQVNNWYKKHYGTHDWIAEAALDAIKQDDSTKVKWEGEGDNPDFWTEKRQIIFLIGTEAPDISRGKLSMKFTYYGDNGNKDEVWLTGLADTSKHHIYYYHEDEANPKLSMHQRTKDTADARAKHYAEKARIYLEKGYCEVAAFYMGVVTHYIADCGSFFHVLDAGKNSRYDFPDEDDEFSKAFAGLHTKFENKIQEVTDNHYDREKSKGFTYIKNFDIENKKPFNPEPTVDECVRSMAFDTRWDCQIAFPRELNYVNYEKIGYITPGEKDAMWLYENFFPIQDHAVRSWNAEFKARIQDNLNLAIICCAKAINYMADYWVQAGKVCKECTEDSDPDPSKKPSISFLSIAIGLMLAVGIACAIGIPFTYMIAWAISQSKEQYILV